MDIKQKKFFQHYFFPSHYFQLSFLKAPKKPLANYSFFKKSAGFTTIEIVMASVIMSVCLSAVVMVIWYERVMALSSEMAQQALYLAQEALETARVNLKSNFWLNITSSHPQASYTIAVSQKFLTNWSKEVTATVSWNSEVLSNHQLSLNTLVYDSNQIAEADSCDLYLSGNWQNPQVLPANINIGANTASTAIAIKNNFLYITADPAVASAPDFFVVDISDINNPVIKSSKNTGVGLADLVVVGNYAYVANITTVNQLQVINISNPLATNVVYDFSTYNSVAALSIAYSNKKIYLGTKISGGNEFFVIDIAENPAAPKFLGSMEIGTSVNDIKIVDHYAILATPNSPQVRVIDISDPAHMSMVGSFTYDGFSTLSGKSLYVKGDKAYFGRNGLNNGKHKFFSLDLVSMSAPAYLDSKDLGSTPNAIFERGGLVFLATNDSAKEFQVWQDNGQGSLSHISDIDLPAEAVDITCQGQTMFVAQSSSDVLKIITFGP